MIVGLDSSSFRPSAATARAARAAGIRLWSGYLTTRANVGLASPWAKGDFDNARLCGSMPIAFCSGRDDPVACRALAASWNVRLCLDVEGGIRGNGPWVQSWLDVSGAGLYGAHGTHAGRRAAFYVLGAYPVGGDPFGASWDSTPRPSGPCGWQWVGTHTEFGGGVDRGDYDDWFGGDDVDKATFMAWLGEFFAGGTAPGQPNVGATIAASLQTAQGIFNMDADEVTKLAAVKDELTRIETALSAGGGPGTGGITPATLAVAFRAAAAAIDPP